MKRTLRGNRFVLRMPAGRLTVGHDHVLPRSYPSMLRHRLLRGLRRRLRGRNGPATIGTSHEDGTDHGNAAEEVDDPNHTGAC